MIYLDNGATSYPKPPEVIEAVTEVMSDYCANPGRAGHFMAARTAQEIYRSRLFLARLFNTGSPGRIVFTGSCTESLNLALKGLLNPGDHVVTTSMEHNSVMRPLHSLEKKGVEVSIVRGDRQGRISPAAIRQAIRPDTKLIVVTAASNVTGTKAPLEEIGRIALRNGIIFMVDAAQGAGHMQIDAKAQHIDILAAPGHKGLLGPQGTGLLYIREGLKLRPFKEGGTGTRSKELDQPSDMPEGFEAGTLNSPGIIALGAAARVITRIGIDVIEEHERRLCEKLERGLRNIDGVTLYGPEDTREKTAVTALNIDGLDCEDAAEILSSRYGIAVRAGFHCSGTAHETIGTADRGCVRITPGIYTSEKEITETVEAIGEIAKQAQQMRHS